MQAAEWYDWKIGWDIDGEFVPDAWREDGSEYGDSLYLEFECYNCKSTVSAWSKYEGVPLHTDSMIRASQIKPKCKCGAIYVLNEMNQEYEIERFTLPQNPNQILLFK